MIDLKIEDFEPEFAGKMNFYMSAVDELERRPGDGATIGLVLCPGRSCIVTQWALRGVDAPVAVARYANAEITMTAHTPDAPQPALPRLASKLADITEAAAVVYEGQEPQ